MSEVSIKPDIVIHTTDRIIDLLQSMDEMTRDLLRKSKELDNKQLRYHLSYNELKLFKYSSIVNNPILIIILFKLSLSISLKDRRWFVSFIHIFIVLLITISI